MIEVLYKQGRYFFDKNIVQLLQSIVGESPLISIDCITPFQGKPDDLIRDLCTYLNGINPKIQVLYNSTSESDTETNDWGAFVNKLVIQVNVVQND